MSAMIREILHWPIRPLFLDLPVWLGYANFSSFYPLSFLFLSPLLSLLMLYCCCFVVTGIFIFVSLSLCFLDIPGDRVKRQCVCRSRIRQVAQSLRASG